MSLRFEARYPFHKRHEDALNVMKRFPDRIPVIVQLGKPGVLGLSRLKRNKYLVPSDMKMGRFLSVIRSKLFARPHQALYIMTKKKNIIPASSSLMISVYHDNKDDDYFLYLDLWAENAFG